MKKFIAIIAAVAMLVSCKKETSKIEEDKNNHAAPIVQNGVTWEELPSDLRNAIEARENNVDKTSSSSRSSLFPLYTLYYSAYGDHSGIYHDLRPNQTDSYVEYITLGVRNSSYVSYIDIEWRYPGSDYRYGASAGKILKGDVFNSIQFKLPQHIVQAHGGISDVLNNITFIMAGDHFIGKDSISAGTPGGQSFTSSEILPGFCFAGITARLDAYDKINLIGLTAYCMPWRLFSSRDAQDVAIASDGTRYMVNTVGKIYKSSTYNYTWVQMAGSDGKSIAANANRLCMVNTAGKIYEFLGSTWRQLPGSDAVDITINSDGKLWMVNTAGLIYQYNDAIAKWTLMPGSSASRIAAGSNMVWMVNSVGKIYKWSGTSWTLIQGSDGKDIAVGNDGSVWLTNTSGTIYQFNYYFFDELCGTNGFHIAANNKEAFLVNSVGDVYSISY